ncbi:hypothetical protein YC2023_120208 [Brassica napus]
MVFNVEIENYFLITTWTCIHGDTFISHSNEFRFLTYDYTISYCQTFGYFDERLRPENLSINGLKPFRQKRVPDLLKDAFDGVTSVISCVGGFGSNSYMYKINGTADINAIRAASEKGVKRFVYISAADFGLAKYLLSGYYEGKVSSNSFCIVLFWSSVHYIISLCVLIDYSRVFLINYLNMSDAVMCSAIAVSRDHKPDQSDERERIENAGGFVMWAGKKL